MTRDGWRNAGRGAGHGGLTAPGGGWPGVPGHMPLDGAYDTAANQYLEKLVTILNDLEIVPAFLVRKIDEKCVVHRIFNLQGIKRLDSRLQLTPNLTEQP